MVRRHRNNMISLGVKFLKGLQTDKGDAVVQRMDLKPVNKHSVIKSLLHRLIPIHMEHPPGVVSEMLMAVDQFHREKVIHMGMGNQQVLNLPQIQGII